jgi:hypothetical protein
MGNLHAALAPTTGLRAATLSVSGLCLTGKAQLHIVGASPIYHLSRLHPWSINDFIVPPLPGFSYAVRATNHNNIIIAGDNATLAHFNGISWERYPEVFSRNRRVWKVAVSGKTVVAIGYATNSFFTGGLVVSGRLP